MIKSDRWKPSVSSKVYQPSGREVSPSTASQGEDAYYLLSNMVEGHLGPEGGTVSEIYSEVTRPLGLSLSDTMSLVKNAKKAGYLK